MFEPETDTLTFTEGIGTPGTTVEWVDGDSTLEIEDVEVEVINLDPTASPLDPFLTGLTVSFSDNSFTFSGLFDTWFSRRVTFVREEGVVNGIMTYSFNNQVSNPRDLPPSFYGAHRVESAAAALTLAFTVIGKLTTTADDGEGGAPTTSTDTVELLWNCTIISNYDSNITAVRFAVEQGDAFKRYEEE